MKSIIAIGLIACSAIAHADVTTEQYQEFGKNVSTWNNYQICWYLGMSITSNRSNPAEYFQIVLDREKDKGLDCDKTQAYNNGIIVATIDNQKMAEQAKQQMDEYRQEQILNELRELNRRKTYICDTNVVGQSECRERGW